MYRVLEGSINAAHKHVEDDMESVRRFSLVRQTMRQRMLANLTGKRITRILGAPVAESRPKTVSSYAPSSHSP